LLPSRVCSFLISFHCFSSRYYHFVAHGQLAASEDNVLEKVMQRNLLLEDRLKHDSEVDS
jgi:hypothetical protein